MLEPHILLQIGHPRRPHPNYSLNLFVAQLREPLVVIRRFYHYLVRTHRPHLVVDSVCAPPRFSLNPVYWIGMWHHSNLPGPLRGPGKYRLLFVYRWLFKRAVALIAEFTMPQYDPTLRNRISSDFHSSS